MSRLKHLWSSTVILTSWLNNLRRNRRVQSSRQPVHVPVDMRLPRVAEKLEDKTLLAVSGVLIGTELSVFADQGDDIRIQRGASTGNAEVFIINTSTVADTVPQVQSSTVTRINVFTGSGDNVIDLTQLTVSDFSALTTVNVTAGDGDDVIQGSNEFAESLLGNDGNDTIDGGDGNDTIDAGDGDDSVAGGPGDDILDGDDGHDTVDGGIGIDNITAGDGDDCVVGGFGSDVINAGNGNDTVDAGDGDDLINGMSGNDSISGGSGMDTVFGGTGNDFITGDGSNDTLDGQGGDDTLDGGAGNDSLLGGSRHDSIDGGDGRDTVNGQSGRDTLNGGADNDRLLGGGGNDSLDGGAGNDTVSGQGGDDTLTGGGDSDSVVGGNGNDLIGSGDQDPSVAPIPLPVLTIDDVTVNPEGDDNTSLTFSAPSQFAVINVPFAIDGNDFDGDGAIDLVVATRGAAIGQDMVSVLINNGNGTYGAAVNLQAPEDPNDITTGDFDNDGFIDFAVSGNNQVVGLDVVPHLSNGDGTFTVSPGAVNLNGGGTGLAAVDLDDDGFLDLVSGQVTNSTGRPNALVVFRNNGDGSFATGVVTNSARPALVTEYDANQDALLDVAVVFDDGAGNASLSIIQNNGSGAIGGGTNNPIPGGATDIEILDFDNDGFDDVFISLGASGNIATFRNTGGGMLQNGATIAVGQAADGLDSADYNGDGFVDLLVGAGNAAGPVILFNDGAGNFGSPLNLGAAASGLVFAAELDNSGLPDLAFATGTAAANSFANVILNTTPPQAEATFTVTLSGASSDTVTVNYTTTDGSATAGADYTFDADTLTFAPGVLTQTVTVPIIGDDTNEPNENFFIDLSSPANATIGDSQGHATIVDDDGGTAGPAFSIDDVMQVEGDTGSATFDFTVTLTPALTGTDTATVDFQVQEVEASAGVDFNVLTTGPLSFDSATSTRTISIEVIGDTSFETAETFLVHLLNPVGALITDSQGLFTITDNDVAGPPPVDDDTLKGDNGRDTILASTGNDVIEGGAGADSIDGADGNDSIVGGDDNDTIRGGAGDDTLDGQSGNDLIDGVADDDLVIWSGVGAGVDTVERTSGVVTLVVQGGTEDNTFAVDQTLSLLRITEGAASITASDSVGQVVINGGAGADTITIDDVDDVRALILEVNGDEGGDTINATGASLEKVLLTINGGADNDTVMGSLGDETINGNDGNDSLIGGDGNDLIDGGNGNDFANGGVGNDTLNGGLNNDTLEGATGNDLLSGSFGNDALNGNEDDDTLDGGFGNDTVNGAAGNDVADGGPDQDRVLGGGGNDSLDGGTGDDTIKGQSGNDAIKGGDGNDTIFGNSGADTIDGGDGDDTIDADGGNDIIAGGDGNDTINGMNGRDTIIGGDGNDQLVGGSGVDRIFGEAGDDTLRGNGSTDRFNSGEGVDVLADLAGGELDDSELQVSNAVLNALATLNGF